MIFIIDILLRLRYNQAVNNKIPSTYDGAWLESLDRYTVDDEGTLILSSSRGHIDTKRCLKAGSEEEARDERGYYYLSGDTLILHISSKTRTYERQ